MIEKMKNYINVFDNKENFKRAMWIMALSILCNIFIRIEVLFNASSQNIMIPILLPIAVAGVTFISISLSSLLIQYTWKAKVNYGFALQFSATVDLIVSFVALGLYLFGGVELSRLAVSIGLVSVFILLTLFSYNVAKFTEKKIENEKNYALNDENYDDSFDENDILDEKEEKVKVGFKHIFANLFRSFVIIFVKPFIVMGLAIQFI